MIARSVPPPRSSSPSRPRIGLVVPATDRVSEPAFGEMLAGHPVSVVASRVASENTVSMATLSRMVGDLSRAAALLLPGGRIDVVAFSCTSGTVAAGVDAVARAIADAKPGVPFTTPITAAVAAFRRLGTRRIAVLTPYVDEVNAAIHGFLTTAGLEIVEFGSFHLQTEPEISSVPPEAIVVAGQSIAALRAEALFISCTALQGHAAIAPLEAALARPVVTSNQAQVWEALSLIDYGRPVHGYGRLLESLAPVRAA
jgi:maleate isomerase